jgi:hypothetical protein
LPAVEFDLAGSMEHDLLIRKLFTSGLDNTSVSVSAWCATIAMLRSIWSTCAELPAEVFAKTPDIKATLVKAVCRPRVWLFRRDRRR